MGTPQPGAVCDRNSGCLYHSALSIYCICRKTLSKTNIILKISWTRHMPKSSTQFVITSGDLTTLTTTHYISQMRETLKSFQTRFLHLQDTFTELRYVLHWLRRYDRVIGYTVYACCITYNDYTVILCCYYMLYWESVFYRLIMYDRLVDGILFCAGICCMFECI